MGLAVREAVISDEWRVARKGVWREKQILRCARFRRAIRNAKYANDSGGVVGDSGGILEFEFGGEKGGD